MNQEINIKELQGKSEEEIKSFLLQKGISDDVIKNTMHYLGWRDAKKKAFITFISGSIVFTVLLTIFSPFFDFLTFRDIGIIFLIILGGGFYGLWEYFVFKKPGSEILQNISKGWEVRRPEAKVYLTLVRICIQISIFLCLLAVYLFFNGNEYGFLFFFPIFLLPLAITVAIIFRILGMRRSLTPESQTGIRREISPTVVMGLGLFFLMLSLIGFLGSNYIPFLFPAVLYDSTLSTVIVVGILLSGVFGGISLLIGLISFLKNKFYKP